MKPLQLKIPATSANLGLGFDSMGLAIDKFLTIEAEISEDGQWHFKYLNDALKTLPEDDNNIVAKTAKKVAVDHKCNMPGLTIKMDSQIPLAHGLGSSSSAIAAGIECANYFCNLDLSNEEKIYAGTEIEGHPDNIGPCFTGGVFIGYYHKGDFAYRQLRLDDISLIVSVPEYEISTKEVRASLPESYVASAAVLQNAKNNVMILAMADQDYEEMGRLMMEDCYHEPYRGPLIKEFEEVKSQALNHGAYATVISGAGPTLLTLCPTDQVDQVYEAVKNVAGCQHDQVDVFYYE